MSTKEAIATLTVLISVVAAPVFLAGYARLHRPATYPDTARVVDLTGLAAQGRWTLETVHSGNYWWKSFTPATLHLPQHARVVLRLQSADVLHQFYVPALGLGPVDVNPGHVTELEFRADREGVFQYYCTSLCGDCHFYMTGWIVVTPPGAVPLRPKPIVCTLCSPEPPPPADQGIIARGEYLYRRKGCDACHGPNGRGGVANYNYLNDEITGHHEMASRLLLRDQASARALVDWMAQQPDLPTAAPGPDIAGFGIVRARLLAAMALIRDGKSAAKADLDGPEPPLQMPAWRHRLTDEAILSILSYLISLQTWDEEGDGLQVSETSGK